tara:strand:- start:1304 stop:1807 length:504 start_codon:yes stop_codon:yes gene_type:complete
MAETRYWKRVGMRLTRELAFEMESKMNAKGSYLDEDLEEFTAIDAESSDYKEELEELFSSPDEYAETGDPVNGSAAVIDISYHYYQENRKPRLMAIRAELKEKFEAEKDATISERMAEDSELTLEKATADWDLEVSQEIRQQANELWQEEFDEYVVGLQEQYGVATQ